MLHNIFKIFTYNVENKIWGSKDFPNALQISTINTILKFDKNKFALAGNKFDVDPNIGRQDALPLAVYEIDSNLNFNLITNHWVKNHSEITDIALFETNI
ncbi:MAG: hypothetical protein U0T36_01740 [Saprospiraceae bacterium]